MGNCGLSSMGSGLDMREYVNGDERDIVPLFEKVYGRKMGRTENHRHWRWEFLQNPVKPVSIMLTWHEKRLVGQYAVNPLRVWAGDKELLIALSLDTMTDQDYEKRGIFSGAAKALYDQLAAKGFSFVFGFPNSKSVNGFLKQLGWHIISPAAVHVYPLDAGPVIRIKTKSECLGTAARRISRPALRILGKHVSRKCRAGEVEILREHEFGSWCDELWLRCRTQHALWTVRDFKYLSWRYNMRPEGNYEIFTARSDGRIAGYVITAMQARREGLICFILDILADTGREGVTEALLGSVMSSAMEKDAAMISTLLMPGSVYRSAFRRLCFIPLPQKLFPKEIYFGGRQFDDRLSPQVFQSPTSWHISWGDTDLL